MGLYVLFCTLLEININ